MTALSSSEARRCLQEIAAIEAEILAGNLHLPGLCLALSDWHAELKLVEYEESRRLETRRLEAGKATIAQAIT